MRAFEVGSNLWLSSWTDLAQEKEKESVAATKTMATTLTSSGTISPRLDASTIVPLSYNNASRVEEKGTTTSACKKD